MCGLDRCLADTIRSESSDHGGLFLDESVPSSSVSFVPCKNCTVSSMRFVGKSSFLKLRRRDRTRGPLFLSVSLSIKKKESEGYNGQNGYKSLQLKDSVLIQEAGEKKIKCYGERIRSCSQHHQASMGWSFCCHCFRVSLFLFFTLILMRGFILDLYHYSSIVSL